METFGVWIAAILTLFIFSFLYKENPFYRFAEHLLVGVSAGYIIPYTYYNVFVPYAWNPIINKHEYILILPAIIGIFYIFRFSRKLSWLSRYPIAFSMGIVGMYVPLTMQANVLVQMRSAMLPLTNINTILIFIGTVSILLYFFFSKAHKGLYGKFTSIGIWFMMIGFGSAFGYTVMARISLLIGRIQFLLKDWLHLMK